MGDIQSIARDFVGAYDMLTPRFNTFGAEHYIVSAEIVDGSTSTNNLYQLADNLRNEGSFTQLIEIKMACNSCGNEGTWQLFEGTRVGLPAAVSSSRIADIDECVCGGPVQTDFFEKFKPLVAANNKSISILSAIQIPLLVSQDGTYNEELCSTTEEYKTTYSYAVSVPQSPPNLLLYHLLHHQLICLLLYHRLSHLQIFLLMYLTNKEPEGTYVLNM